MFTTTTRISYHFVLPRTPSTFPLFRRYYVTPPLPITSMARFGKFILAGAVAAGAGFAYDSYSSSSSTSSIIHPNDTNIAGQLISSLSPQDQYIHSTLNQHATVWTIPSKQQTNHHHDHLLIHSTFVASNDPIEDRYAISTLPDGSSLISVFDGHAGWQCSNLLSKSLHNYIARHLIPPSPHSNPLNALIASYTEFDHDLMQLAANVQNMGNSVPNSIAQDMLMPAMAGAVLVTALINDNTIHVAHAGDCRAVIGRHRSPTTSYSSSTGNQLPTWQSVPLTMDHDADNPAEVLRMRSEHPGEEEDVIMRGRILGGLQPFRSMGDARYKWSQTIQEWISQVFQQSNYPYKHLPRNFKTPPYVTARPDVISYTLDNNDEFLVLATDGLWERGTNDQVVNMIGEYLAEKESGKWAHEDHNAAAHVVRNAFGGRDSELVASLLRIPAPLSRQYRDDITVLVVFLRPRPPLSNNIPISPSMTATIPEEADVSKSKITPTIQGLELKSGGSTPSFKSNL